MPPGATSVGVVRASGANEETTMTDTQKHSGDVHSKLWAAGIRVRNTRLRKTKPSGYVCDATYDDNGQRKMIRSVGELPIDAIEGVYFKLAEKHGL